MVVISISIDRGSDEKVRKIVKDYVRRRNLTFLNLLDPNGTTAAQYSVRGIPMTVFINPQGRVVAFASGYRKWESKEGKMMFKQLLSEAK